MFSPSSLLKVPLMIAMLKEAETKPGILQQRLTYLDQPIPIDLRISNLQKRYNGESLTPLRSFSGYQSCIPITTHIFFS